MGVELRLSSIGAAYIRGLHTSIAAELVPAGEFANPASSVSVPIRREVGVAGETADLKHLTPAGSAVDVARNRTPGGNAGNASMQSAGVVPPQTPHLLIDRAFSKVGPEAYQKFER